MSQIRYTVPAPAQTEIDKTLADWRTGKKVARLWAGDASLWTGQDEARWLAWLSVVDDQLKNAERFAQFSAEVKATGFTDAVLLGMGGSSLCPEVLRLSFGRTPGFPDLHVLDSTDPERIAAIESHIDIAKTLFIVASKSGSTLEPNIFKQYFFDRAGRDGRRFIAITDPGSHMEQVAEAGGFWEIFHGVPGIGGRFSALSDFGMIPAAAMGIDAAELLRRAREMARACSAETAIDGNPGALLGIVLGTLARAGHDKLTIFASPGIHDFGAWLEQLIAESTGKLGKGIIPVDREPLGSPEVYGNDRVFVYARLDAANDAGQDNAIDRIERAGHPVIRVALHDVYDVGREFFRWEFATAVAGAILGINTFDQPDVEASKIATRKLTGEFERTGSLPPETPAVIDGGVKIFGTGVKGSTLDECLRAHLSTLKAGDYFALLAYIEMNAAHEAALTSMRKRVRDTRKVATCVGFGPRFLHSTGQAYKGGPNTGVFVQITADDARDLPVPGQTYSFGVVKAAQARGDFQVLAERGRRALRVHLSADVAQGLATLGQALKRALE
ncbi:MAG TPA: bifunctional transaldolase/phosoglucose isomerase [Bryobacteraceae bacterium]|nr:bifunctional transaldolase/phosoglucose isomerase [Bryobacteraceae bacterium]